MARESAFAICWVVLVLLYFCICGTRSQPSIALNTIQLKGYLEYRKPRAKPQVLVPSASPAETSGKSQLSRTVTFHMTRVPTTVISAESTETLMEAPTDLSKLSLTSDSASSSKHLPLENRNWSMLSLPEEGAIDLVANVFDANAGRVERLANTSYCDCIRRSQVMSESCGYKPRGRLVQFLVTGMGRSGTMFLHAELEQLGLAVGHDTSKGRFYAYIAWPEAFTNRPFETHDRHGRVQRKRCEHPSWNFSNKFYLFKHAYQLVREPLKSIQSRWNIGKIGFVKTAMCNTYSIRSKHLSSLDRSLELTMKHWTLWNSMVEQYAEARFRIEDLDRYKQEILVGLVNASRLKEVMEETDLVNLMEAIPQVNVSQSVNSHHTHKSKRPLTWAKLASLNRNFTAMTQIQAMRYKYNVPIDQLLPEVWDDCDPTVFKVQRCFFLYVGSQWACQLYSDRCPEGRQVAYTN